MGFVKEFICMNGHSKDLYEHKREDLYCTPHTACVVCDECGETMTGIFSPGHKMCWIEESRPFTSSHLDTGDGPVTVTSHGQHREAMKKRGVEFAGARKGQKGSWV